MTREAAPALPLRIRLGWATGELAVAAYIGLSQSFMLFYTTTVLLIPPAIAGIALLVPRLIDALLDPVLGAVSDRTRSRFGRRRIYLVIGAPLLGLTFGAVFFVDPGLTLGVRVALLMALFLLSNVAISLYEVPYSAMAAEMTRNYRERIGLTGLKMTAARIGIICSLFFGPIIFRSTEQLTDGFRLLGLVAGTFMVATGLIGFVTTKDAPRIDSTTHRFSLRAEYEAVLRNRPFRTLWLAFLLQNIAIGANSATTIFFVVYIMRMDAVATGPLLAAVSITSVVTLALWVYVARAVGKRTQYMIALAVMAAAALPFSFIEQGMVITFVALMILHGLADSGTQLGPNSMVPDTVEVDQAHSGERREGALFGAWGFCRKLGMTLGAFLVSMALAVVGFQQGAPAAAQPDEAFTGIRMIYGAFPFVLWLGAMLPLMRYDLTEGRFNAIKDELERRNHTPTPAALVAATSTPAPEHPVDAAPNVAE